MPKIAVIQTLTPRGANQTEIEHANGVTVFYSYRTPVAVFVPGHGALTTEQHYSRTTSRHISAAVARWGCSRKAVPQSEINRHANA